MPNNQLVIDADGHVLEPPDLWDNYLEEKYRPRGIKIKKDDKGLEYLEYDGKPAQMMVHGSLHALGAMGRPGRELAPSPEKTYAGSAPFGSMSAKERLDLLDKDGIDKAILYPTIGLLWEAEVEDPEITGAYCRAYNRWIADFCRDSGGRLIPIAHLSLGDPEEAARELRRAVDDGCKGAFVCPFTITRIAHGDPRHDVLFATAQDLDVPLAIHPTFEPLSWGVHHRFDGMEWASWYADLFAAQGVQHAFATLFQYGVFDRFPKLRVVVLEAQAGWIGYLLDRADAIYNGTILGSTVKLK